MQDEELEFENNLIQLEDEDGNPTSFEFLDLIPYEGKEYVVLLPADEDADEVEILELAELDDEMEEYRSIEDTAILEAVFEIFKEKFKDVMKHAGKLGSIHRFSNLPTFYTTMPQSHRT